MAPVQSSYNMLVIVIILPGHWLWHRKGKYWCQVGRNINQSRQDRRDGGDWGTRTAQHTDHHLLLPGLRSHKQEHEISIISTVFTRYCNRCNRKQDFSRLCLLSCGREKMIWNMKKIIVFLIVHISNKNALQNANCTTKLPYSMFA